MTSQPFTFRLPIQDFDTSLLPPGARVVGSDAFKDAVVDHFVGEYGTGGQVVVVAVDDTDINVVQLAQGADPLDFVMSMLQGGRIAEAVPFLEAMAKTDPDSVPVLYNLGIAYSELRQLDEAVIRLKKAVRIQPGHAHAWTGIGVAYQRMGKREQALEALQRAVAAAPDDGYGLRNLAGTLMSLGRTGEALPLLRRARKALPHDPQATYGLAMALASTGDEADADEADELYKVVIDRWPSSKLAELAREARTKTAHKNLKAAVGGGLRPDVMMYLAGALDTFEKVGPAKTRDIAFEVAMKGQEGLDINDSAQKYTLKTLPGKFSGLHLVAIMYAGFRQLDPNLDAGIDFAAEYQAAQAMRPPK
ncbi:MAG: tetratricopeptide repeat protein [Pseudomonadota bacterium]